MKKQNNAKRSKKPERRYGEGQSYKSDGMDRDKTRPEREDLKGRTKGSNDAGWYQVDSQLMKDAAQLSFPVTAGRAITVNGLNANPTNLYMPGIAVFGVVPTYGEMKDWNSPFNVAIRKTYSWIRHANSGHSNYDAADLGQYFIAYDAACTYYAWMVRCYGLVRTLIVQNAYTPERLVNACGCNYEDLAKNLAQLRAYINTYAVRLQALKVPSDLHFMERHMWLFTHVYADAPLAKCSFYLFNPISVWKHVISATEDRMVLDTSFFNGMAKPSKTEGATYLKIMLTGNDILNNVLNNEDFNIMSGDIIKAYGDKVFTLNLITEDYQVTPVYDPEVLIQIRNATVPCFNFDEVKEVVTGTVTVGHTELCSIRERTKDDNSVGATQFKLKFPASVLKLPSSDTLSVLSANKVTCGATRVITMPVSNPSPAEICVATRFTSQWWISDTLEDYTDGDTTVKTDMIEPSAFGTELILTMSYLARPDADWFTLGSQTVNATQTDAEALVTLEKLDWAPSLYIGATRYTKNDTANPKTFDIGNVRVALITGDWDNTTNIDEDTLHNIHRAAVLGMFELAL